MRFEQPLNFRSQVSIVAARRCEERRPFLSTARERGVKQLFDARPTIRVHHGLPCYSAYRC
jgi:hypothetical protein